MISKIKKPVSILLSLIMVFSMFTIVPLSASAAIGDVLSEDDYLTFTAETANSTVTLNVQSGSNFQYDLNGTGLKSYTAGTPITLENEGDYVRFSGTGTKFNSSNHVSLTGKVACSGNVMSLRLNGGRIQALENLCFRYMFYNCTGLTTAPDLLETDLKAGCYSHMFNGCTSLTTAPDLPATTLAESCYSYMFYGCEGLTTAPDLLATTLAESCYSYMFNGCTSLTTAPDLHATVLASNCYQSMFNGCTSLTEAPELPATTLANYCYQNMFKGCTKLTEAPELTATTLASYCYSNMFRDCKSLTEAPELPATNLAQYCYASMFMGCTSLTELPELSATNLAESCYNSMFYGCKSIKISGEADTEYSAEYKIPSAGTGTTASNALTNMFLGTGGKFKGTPDINTIYYVPAPAPETFKVYVKKLTGETYTIENLTGETTVAQLKEIIADQIDIPATAQRLIFAGKELEDAKTLAEYNIEKESTIHLVIRGYTVTWLNYDNSELGTTTVQYGATPSYDGTPERPEDANNTYTFAAWDDGETTYVLGVDDLPPVTGDITYKAVYTADPKTPELPDVIKDCTYYDSYCGFYANVPFAERFSDIKNGAIICDSYSDTEKSIMDTKDYSYKFYDQTGTELQAENVYHDDSADGYGFRVIMNVFEFSNPISGPLYIVATEPAPAPVKLILNVGENGKVVMDNGNFGNATDASNITEISVPGNVADGAKVFIADGHSVNLAEGGSINIATGGEVSFYPSADNTGVITAIPAEGYVFAGWYNGDTLYSSDAALSYQSISEDMTLTAKFAPKLFIAHSITLGGDIGVNFFLNPDVLDTYTGTKTVKFTCDGEETTFGVPATPTADGYMVTRNVVAAQMAHTITATLYVGGEPVDTDEYSVREYAEKVFANPKKYDSEKPEQLKALAKALLNYGAMAQTVFADYLNDKTPAPANTTVGTNGYSEVTAEQIAAAIKGTASNLNKVATQLGAKYYTNSLFYLQNNTLRIYFTPTSYPGEIPNAGAYAGSLSNYYYYVDHKDIPAAELDDQKEFAVGGTTFTFSALDYAKAVVESTKMDPDQKNLAKSLYLYNQAANAYFD